MPTDMPADEACTVQCPVCRATQASRQTCRRCTADLTLFIRVQESSRAARRRLVEAVAANDQAAQARLRDYLKWLHG
jgi:hypothetical protein